MFSQLFGSYLVSEDIISPMKLNEVLKKATGERVRLGTIAVAEGILTEKEAEEINQLQARYDKKFGDIAIEKGYLEESQVEYLLTQQGNPFMQFIQLLFEEDCITPVELEYRLADFQEQQGFTDDDMEALKHEDLDQIVNLFAFASKPYVTELIGLLLRNITRFVTDDFYIGRIERQDEYVSSAMVMQRIFGDHSIYLGLGAADKEDGFVATGSGYAREYFKGVNNMVYDALSEFINTISGLFATNLSHEGVSMDMEPPYAYANQIVQGSSYKVPMYVHGNRVDIFVSVDSELTFARKPLDLEIETIQGSEANDYSKANVVIVDDSALTRKVLREMLEEEGYTVVCEAVNGKEAVEAYKTYKPDVITLDITMPIMDGVEALKQIVAMDPKVRAIMITAAGQEKRVIEALRIGAQHFVVKPFKREDVLKTIDSYFA